MTTVKNNNFDIEEMINSFSFENLIKRDDTAAVLFITDKQYVLSYTENYGDGLHFNALKQIYQCIYGEKKLYSYTDISNDLVNYISANIYFVDNEISIYINSLKNINKNNYNSFLNFFEDYRYIIENLDISINIGFYDKYNSKFINSNNFDKFKSYLETHINYKYKKDYVDEIIIGVSTYNLKKEKR